MTNSSLVQNTKLLGLNNFQKAKFEKFGSEEAKVTLFVCLHYNRRKSQCFVVGPHEVFFSHIGQNESSKDLLLYCSLRVSDFSVTCAVTTFVNDRGSIFR